MALTYRMWAEAEFNCGEAEECPKRLRDALLVVAAMPDFSEFKGFEARACVADLLTCWPAITQKRGLIDVCRETLAVAAAAMQPFADDASRESAASVAMRRAHGLNTPTGIQRKPCPRRLGRPRHDRHSAAE